MKNILKIPWPGKSITIIRLKHFLPLLLILAALLLPAACEKGDDGWPGRAYVALSWYGHEPEFIEIENEYIPSVFYWDEFYRVAPGLYWVYYEGSYRRGGRDYAYAWELDYEVWENPGERGRPFKDGEDGPDAYFTVELTPEGPEIYHEDASYRKSAEDGNTPEIISNSGEEIILEKQDGNFSIRIRYRKTESRNALTGNQ